MDQLSLFTEPEQTPEQVGEKENDNEQAKETKERKIIPAGWFVAYCGHQIPVNEDTEVSKMLKMLERRYPELSPGRVEMIFDEKKKIVVPWPKGGKKGAR